jgi:hypothetical protein
MATDPWTSGKLRLVAGSRQPRVLTGISVWDAIDDYFD